MNIKIYEPNKYIKQGFFSSLKSILEDIRVSYELGLRLFKRDFSAKYKQSLFGLLWVVLSPIFTVLVFTILNVSGVLNVGDTKIPYIIYALFGLTVWNLFTALVLNITGSVLATGNMISKINFPRIALIYSPIFMALVDFLVRVTFLITLIILLHITPVFKYIPIAILTLLPLVFFAIAIGLICSVVSIILRDISNILGILFSFLIFLSPVIYPTEGRGGIFTIIAKYNPLTYLIDFPRTVLFFGNFNGINAFLLITTVSIVLFILAWRFFNVAISKVVERI